MTSALAFAWRRRERQNLDSQGERAYLDFLVDGVSLRTTLGVERDDRVGVFCRELVSEPPVPQLLGKAATEGLRAGRVALYVCAECGDIYCGAVTARLSIDELVTWDEFAVENRFPIEDGLGYFEAVEAEPIAFSRAQYEGAIKAAASEVAKLVERRLTRSGD